MCRGFSMPVGDGRGQYSSGDTPQAFTCNSSYPKTLPAILKVIQAIFSLISFICAVSPQYWTTSSYHAYNYLVWVCQWHMWGVIILYLLVVLNVHHRLRCIHWALTELIFYAFATLFFLTASIAALVFSTQQSANSAMVAAAVFAFLCVFLYGAGAYLSFREWRLIQPRQPATVTA